MIPKRPPLSPPNRPAGMTVAPAQPPRQMFGAGVEQVPPEILAAMLKGDEHIEKEADAAQEQRQMMASALLEQKAQPVAGASGVSNGLITLGGAMKDYAKGYNAREERNKMAASANQWMPVVTKNG